MRISSFEAKDCEIALLINSYDPADFAAIQAMYTWCDSFVDGVYTHQMNIPRDGYHDAAHCSGFDFYGTKRMARMFLHSWRKSFDDAELLIVDDAIGRAGVI